MGEEKRLVLKALAFAGFSLVAVSGFAADDSRFVWVKPDPSAVPFAPLAKSARPEAAARHALASMSGRLGLSREQADVAELAELHDTGGTQVARFRQKILGIPVHGGELNVVMDRSGHAIGIGGAFARVKKAPEQLPPELYSPALAVSIALADLQKLTSLPVLAIEGEPKVRPTWFEKDGRLVYAHQLWFHASAPGASPKDYLYIVSASTGAVLLRKNLESSAFTYRVYADASAPFKPFDGPLGNARTPFPSADPDNEPLRVAATANLVTLNSAPFVSDPWLPGNATSTLGNNVDAYSDVNAPEGIANDERAPISSAGTFDHAATPDGDPGTNSARRAGIVNLFYVDNWLHDFWYAHGFNEAAGNAQENNFGRGGAEGDRIDARAQSHTEANNASMVTPPDGTSPVQRMGLWDSHPARITALSPALGGLQTNIAQFSPYGYDLTQGLVLVNDGSGTTTDGCEAFSGVSGKIALIDRGTCNYTVKAQNAQTAGAAGVVIANNVADDGAPSMGGTVTVGIPVLSTSYEHGQLLKSALGSGAVTVRMQEPPPSSDSALDNATIAHEFFHYVSGRLVGDASGLNTDQANALGEGWSDFAALMLVVRPEDTGVSGNASFGGAYGLGTYLDTSAWFGTRRVAYSTDFAINPLTFRHIADAEPLPTGDNIDDYGVENSEAHNAGEIWANALWEAYAALLRDPRHSFAEAQSLMADYLIAGLKATPVNPTFTEARDALIAAARANDEQDARAMFNAFAERGMGLHAQAPERYSGSFNDVVESFQPPVPAYSIVDAVLTDVSAAGISCDFDGVLDPGETGQLTLTVVSDGYDPLPAGAQIDIATSSNFGFPSGSTVTLPAMAIGERKSFSVPIDLDLTPVTGKNELIQVVGQQAGGSDDAVLEGYAAVPVTLNMDLARTRTTDDLTVPEASRADWITSVIEPTVATGLVKPWELDAIERVWHGVDNGSPASSVLVSPAFSVSGAFSLSFQHFFEFEPADADDGTFYDGGVIEVSVNGGAYQDVVSFGATFSSGAGYNGLSTAFSPARQAFVDTNGGAQAVTLNFGTKLAGKTARIRFRLDSDQFLGGRGWYVNQISMTGASPPAFLGPVDEDNACEASALTASAGPDQSVAEGSTVTLPGSVAGGSGGTPSYQWIQLAGPPVTLVNASTATASFVAPQVSGASAVVLQLTVTSGTQVARDSVQVRIADAAPAGGGGGGGGGLPLASLAFLLLAALARKKDL